MTAANQIQLVTVDEYLAGELRSKMKHEYTGGYVYARAGATAVHNTIAVAFVSQMYNALRGKPCRPFNSDMKVRVRMASHTRFYYPDGMVVCELNPPREVFQDRPVILAEVISEATRRIDEGEKRDAYLAIPELRAYLLIESSSPRVIADHRTDSGFVSMRYEGLDATIPLDAIGTQLVLRELYENVDFAGAAQGEDSRESE